ncbi:PAS/PAC sensor signal transduction histidine kinase [Sulfurimonas gotlandica GD1]|jgi:PAS domain S-box-containing protein|uniref:histidine kinase n=1 Tax=Sulfurimonas gotlandica (strain DSM 19862 / JCM 16533 / GD1) TaxID=929558 RepID=B6BNA5_SULGG|nr:HAMP domain-containing sensor histidine kinase [Sulfurimonas gotlandica]EDZ61346.1 PAS/PAC sensor signal transduction histidine kinase [Sulfurimonas gotlandica GD1]EHP30975.1 PAS/PAC sensor signal transduction histidine kinase [Sulfurimonas gotlandica GD1]
MLKQYKEAIEKSNIISRTDVEGIITFVNDEFCKISGYSKDELIGKNHNIVRHPDVPASRFKALWDTILEKKIYKDTVKNLAKDGSTFYVNTTVIPILDEDDKIAEFIAIRYDVTNEVFYKEQLQQKEKELEELNQTLEMRVQDKTKELEELNITLEQRVKDEVSKNEEKQKVMFLQSRQASLGQMLANVAHQWRQPLTELNLAMFNMKKAALDNKTDVLTELYGESKNIIKNMSQTIDDFTNFFNPQKEKHPFNISDSINESLSLLDKMLESEMISVKTNFENLTVLGISNELTQVIINIIKNAKDAFVTNSILIREISITTKKEDNFALIEVEDNAGGIKKENIDNIFEPYFTTKHQSSGTGLGLFMSKMICEQGMAGHLDVRSKKGVTTFSIKIPLVSDER